jgi:hypothetical protein
MKRETESAQSLGGQRKNVRVVMVEATLVIRARASFGQLETDVSMMRYNALNGGGSCNGSDALW